MRVPAQLYFEEEIVNHIIIHLTSALYSTALKAGFFMHYAPMQTCQAALNIQLQTSAPTIGPSKKKNKRFARFGPFLGQGLTSASRGLQGVLEEEACLQAEKKSATA